MQKRVLHVDDISPAHDLTQVLALIYGLSQTTRWRGDLIKQWDKVVKKSTGNNEKGNVWRVVCNRISAVVYFFFAISITSLLSETTLLEGERLELRYKGL